MAVVRRDRFSAALGHPLDTAQVYALERFAARLEAGSRVINLTSVRDAAGIERRHVIESLSLINLLEVHSALPLGGRVIDVGTGAGLPGIPLAIVRPDLGVVMLDATAKKTAFVRETAAALDLSHAHVATARAEEAGQDPAHRECYDLAVARAVAPLAVLAELTLPLVRVGGWVAAVKGSRVQEELLEAKSAITQCGGTVTTTVPLPTEAGDPLSVVLVRKEKPTPRHLPRRPGTPSKQPLR
ncbi:MAG: 16S rRNA (guanine(527)-N(7))-methyltransferase RsmG [Chloroflexi bacterium]|nr:16S rRNA (guanine(527)-N(7))-methyltransferase RsmG [Chloroflexota bacterium]